jgi:hypothetical protein
MIIISIKGGLGNQMFQYAFGRKMSLINNTQLYLDLSWFNEKNQDFPRKYVLNKFNINAEIADPVIIRKIRGGFSNYHSIYNRILKKIFPFLFKNNISEKTIIFDATIFNHNDDKYYDGYWQNYRYFNDINNIILKELTVLVDLENSKNDLLDEIRNRNSISIHIRRGDYAKIHSTKEFHGLLPKKYFESSIEKIVQLVDKPHFYFFSDDIAWVKENFNIEYPHSFVENSPDGAEYIDLILMSMCKHNIIANSSFSWWAAWLNNYQEKIVIVPPVWSKAVPDSSEIVPTNWDIINY